MNLSYLFVEIIRLFFSAEGESSNLIRSQDFPVDIVISSTAMALDPVGFIIKNSELDIYTHASRSQSVIYIPLHREYRENFSAFNW